MKYEKPEILVLGRAASHIQGQGKGDTDVPDHTGFLSTSAYESDE
jgi:hypothetical protein